MSVVANSRQILALLVLTAFRPSLAQQVSSERITAQLLHIVEQELERAQVDVSPQGRTFLQELVGNGAESIYRRDDLSMAVAYANALAARLIEVGNSRSAVSPRVVGNEDHRRDVCPLEPFC